MPHRKQIMQFAFYTALTLLLYSGGPFSLFVAVPLILFFSQRNSQSKFIFMSTLVVVLGLGYQFLLPFLVQKEAFFSHLIQFVDIPGIFFWLQYKSVNATALWGIGFLGFWFLAALLIGALQKKQASNPFVGLAIGSLVLSGLVTLLFLVTYRELHLSVLEELRTLLNSGFEALLSQIKTTGEIAPDQMAVLSQNLQGMTRYTFMSLPSMLFSFILFLLSLNYAVSSSFLALFKVNLSIKRLSEHPLPFAWVWVVIAGVAWVLFRRSIEAVLPLAQVGTPVVLNILISLCFIYFLQGIFILIFWIRRWNLGLLPRIFLLSLFLLFFQILLPLLAGLGFFDSWMNLRKKVGPVAKGR